MTPDGASAELDVRTLALEKLFQEHRHRLQAAGDDLDLAELSLGQSFPAVLAELVDELADLRQGEPGVLRQLHDDELRERTLIEDTAAREARRPRDQALLLIEAYCRGGDAGAA